MVTQDKKVAFAKRINQILDAANFLAKGGGRQLALGKLFDVSQKGARKWLEGEAIPRHETILKIAERFSVDPAWLEYGTESPATKRVNEGAASYSKHTEEEELVIAYRKASTEIKAAIQSILKETQPKLTGKRLPPDIGPTDEIDQPITERSTPA